jgi:allantoicase
MSFRASLINLFLAEVGKTRNLLSADFHGSARIRICLPEASIVTSSAIYNAIGKWIDDFPTTPDKVLKALGKI